MKKIITLICRTIFSSAFTQIGINTLSPTETLDVNGTARLRNLVDIDGANQTGRFNKKILSDANGVLGYASNISKATFGLNDISQSIMTTVVSSTGSGNLVLNISTTVIIPVNTEALIIVDYNIPVYKDPAGVTYYAGIKLMKSTNGGADQELEQGSRKYSFPNYSGNGGAALGFPVVGKAVDRIVNNTGSPVTIVYKPLGYIETSTSTVSFGMWSNTSSGQPNYNWGRGLMTTTSYFKAL